MQKYILIPLLLVGYVTVAEKTDTEKVQDAIEKLDLEKVTELLKEMRDLPREDKTSLVKKAQAALSNARENVSLANSKWDLAKYIGGSAAAGVGSYLAFSYGFGGWYFRSGSREIDYVFPPNFINKYAYDLDARDRLGMGMYIVAGVSGAIALVGGYYAWKGYYCDTAYGRVKIARKIATLVKEARIEEVQEPEVQQPAASPASSSTPLRTES